MSLVGNSEVETLNVVPLFANLGTKIKTLVDEVEVEVEEPVKEEKVVKTAERLLVRPNQFPDQSIIVLNEQMKSLKNTMDRLKFYLGDLEDILPR
jgi:cell fate (sporulation/competence/biofilm development) regulator YlbF (YheA/YmcA/DUF963 family)